MKALTKDKMSSSDGNTALFNTSSVQHGKSYGGRSTLDNRNGEDTYVWSFRPEPRVGRDHRGQPIPISTATDETP